MEQYFAGVKLLIYKNMTAVTRENHRKKVPPFWIQLSFFAVVSEPPHQRS